MTEKNWKAFCQAREEFRLFCEAMQAGVPMLHEAQLHLLSRRGGPEFLLLRGVVYNEALDNVTQADEPALILVGDNPGRREQESGHYLVGPSGKLAENFFTREAVLGFDLRKNVVILNKTPIFTPLTGELAALIKMFPDQLTYVLRQSELFMAEMLEKFWRALAKPTVWITGYSQMGTGGVFADYTEALRKRMPSAKMTEKVLVFRHFSRSQFAIDLKKRRAADESTAQALERIGAEYRDKFLGNAGGRT